MKSTNEILAHKEHRSFPHPDTPWKFYQEWHDAVLLHWTVPIDVMQKMIPADLTLDTFQGEAYISLFAFTAEKSRPWILPPVPIVSDFLEINIRTYVKRDDRPGIYFLNMEAGKALSAYIFRTVTGFPYVPAKMRHLPGNFISVHDQNHHYLDIAYTRGKDDKKKQELDQWLVERYCVYLDLFGKMLRYDVHHEPWPLEPLSINSLRLKYKLGDYLLKDQKPVLSHYSKGVEVVGWLPKIFTQ